MNKLSKTNWAKVDALKDEDIDYTDIPEGTDELFKTMTRFESNKIMVNLRLDKEIVEFYKAEGPGYQTRINEALLNTIHKPRIYRTKKLVDIINGHVFNSVDEAVEATHYTKRTIANHVKKLANGYNLVRDANGKKVTAVDKSGEPLISAYLHHQRHSIFAYAS